MVMTMLAFGSLSSATNLAVWYALGSGAGGAGTDPLLPVDGMVLEATADGGTSTVETTQHQTGPYDVCLGVSAHKPGKQLVYQSRAVLEVIRDGEVAGRRGLEARYASGGAFLVQALVDGAPVGFSLYLEETSVVLRIEESAAGTSYFARAPQAVEGEAGWQLVHADTTPPPATPYRFAFGGHDLGEGSGFVYHAFSVAGSSLVNPAQQEAVERIGLATLEFDRAEEALSGPEPDVALANACAEAAMALLKEASGLVKSGGADDAFDAGAKEKKALKRRRSKTKVALKVGDKIEKGKSDNVQAMSKRISAARSGEARDRQPVRLEVEEGQAGRRDPVDQRRAVAVAPGTRHSVRISSAQRETSRAIASGGRWARLPCPGRTQEKRWPASLRIERPSSRQSNQQTLRNA